MILLRGKDSDGDDAAVDIENIPFLDGDRAIIVHASGASNPMAALMGNAGGGGGGWKSVQFAEGTVGNFMLDNPRVAKKFIHFTDKSRDSIWLNKKRVVSMMDGHADDDPALIIVFDDGNKHGFGGEDLFHQAILDWICED